VNFLIYFSGSQPVVRVPLGVHGGPVGVRQNNVGNGGNSWRVLITEKPNQGVRERKKSWEPLIYLILPAAPGPEVYSASNRNEYQKQENNNVSGE
jgi:hypothetical protein